MRAPRRTARSSLRVWVASLLALLAIAGRPRSARAESTEQAAELVAVAERARRLGEYAFAIHAFKQAHDIVPSADRLFSIAEVYHQRHLLEGRAYDRLQAAFYYRSYLEASARGPHRDAAQRALTELEALAAGGAADDDAQLARAEAEERSATRIAVTSTALGAQARVDGGPRRALPFMGEIAPGPHTVVVEAPGYVKKSRALTAVRGFVTLVAFDLEPQAAMLMVRGPDGAALHVDGRVVGVLPLDEPLAVEPGSRFVAVTQTGYEPYGREITIARGKDRELEIDLQVTGQRIAAGVLMGGGASSLAAGIVFGVLSVVEQRAARALAQAVGGPLNAAQQAEYAGYIERRDDYRVASGAFGGVGLGLFLVGGALFLLDEPVVPGANDDVAFTPVIAPRLAGGALTLRF